MTKKELIKILEPYSDDIKLVMSDGEDIVSALYLPDDGDGVIILSDKENE